MLISNWLEMVAGCRRGEDPWSIEYHRFPRDPNEPGVWAAVEEYPLRRWPHERAGELPIACCAIDSGFHTQAVYDFCRTRFHRRVFAIKGKAGSYPVWPKKPTRTNLGKVPLWIVGTIA